MLRAPHALPIPSRPGGGQGLPSGPLAPGAPRPPVHRVPRARPVSAPGWPGLTAPALLRALPLGRPAFRSLLPWRGEQGSGPPGSPPPAAAVAEENLSWPPLTGDWLPPCPGSGPLLTPPDWAGASLSVSCWDRADSTGLARRARHEASSPASLGAAGLRDPGAICWLRPKVRLPAPCFPQPWRPGCPGREASALLAAAVSWGRAAFDLQTVGQRPPGVG